MTYKNINILFSWIRLCCSYLNIFLVVSENCILILKDEIQHVTRNLVPPNLNIYIIIIHEVYSNLQIFTTSQDFKFI